MAQGDAFEKVKEHKVAVGAGVVALGLALYLVFRKKEADAVPTSGGPQASKTGPGAAGPTVHASWSSVPAATPMSQVPTETGFQAHATLHPTLTVTPGDQGDGGSGSGTTPVSTFPVAGGGAPAEVPDPGDVTAYTLVSVFGEDPLPHLAGETLASYQAAAEQHRLVQQQMRPGRPLKPYQYVSSSALSYYDTSSALDDLFAAQFPPQTVLLVQDDSAQIVDQFAPVGAHAPGAPPQGSYLTPSQPVEAPPPVHKAGRAYLTAVPMTRAAFAFGDTNIDRGYTVDSVTSSQWLQHDVKDFRDWMASDVMQNAFGFKVRETDMRLNGAWPSMGSLQPPYVVVEYIPSTGLITDVIQVCPQPFDPAVGCARLTGAPPVA